MIKLIKTELIKIFHKKSIYIILILMFIFCLLNNILYKIDYDENGNYKYLEQEQLKEEEQSLKEELTKYNKDNINEISMYITIKTKLDIIELKKTFSDNSWQYKKINTYLYDIIYKLNNYKYGNLMLSEYDKILEEYQLIIKKLKEDDWLYFLEQEKLLLEETIYNLTETINVTTDKKEKIELEKQLEEQRFNLKVLNYRINNNIPENNDYLNNALEEYQKSYKIVKYYQNIDMDLKHQEKVHYFNSLSNMEINKYIIENKQNINKQNNLNYQLRTIIEDYEIFFVILILVLSGTILCDEFRDGTIKLLLIKPYSRGKILLSKYFSIIIVLGINILCLVIFQLLIGGIIFGYNSMDLPVVIYNFNCSMLIEYSVIKYMIIRIMTKLPFFIVLISITMLIGVISSSIIISITIPLLLYMFTPTLESLAIQYNLEFMKYLININWNMQGYLFGNIKEFSMLTVGWSLFIIIIYLLVIWMLTLKTFCKKDIKNI